ncbi:5'-3'-deoxyribonucleotidase [Metasolibacillus sp.]|uniref:5' nucleotidase, NT5C type n=1 Tax=Metasolibacillus sp. TaxID=2703680 RepID=UPI0025F33585|nr:5'-3'-deoxyribonucleotidase [Metasolibacillus sp.]MCT6923648.1 5'-3'-deoxyribonucleotidase [Metasolibacillus sp.]MCT6939629.1 5'-3'-deoxyribonucleotidase [Metasolibacillus sp.]
MRKSIAIDMDQVLANFYKKLCTTCNERFGTSYTDEEFIGGTRRNLPDEQMKKLYGFMNEADFFGDLELLDQDAIEVVKNLQEHYDIFIATAAMEVPGSFNAKYDWLERYFPFINKQNIVFCGTKSVIHTDYLIDDSPYQLEAFKGTGILYSMPYNQTTEGFIRMNNWKEIEAYFQEQLIK